MLNEFRSTYITWDKATSRIYSPVTANESDENGRKLVVQIVNGGQVEDLTGTTLHLYWETIDTLHYGLDVFKAVELKKGKFELSYTAGMLSNKGALNANLVLINKGGRVVSERFKITVTEGINSYKIQSEDSFTSLTRALIDIINLEQNYAPRLNELTAQLAQKANRGEARESTDKRPINVSEMDTETKQLFTGGAVAVVEENAVGNENMKPKSVTVDKASFISITSTNLFNKEDVIEGHSIDETTGKPVVSTPNNVSHFIPLSSNLHSFFLVTRIAYYDINYNFISTEAIGTGTHHGKIAPPESKYLRIVVNNDYLSKAQVNAGAELLPYENYSTGIRSLGIDGKRVYNLNIKKADIDSIEPTSNNLFDKDNVFPFKTIEAKSGELVDNEQFYASDFIKVKPQTNYTFLAGFRYVFYSIKKQIIKTDFVPMIENTITLNSDTARYVRVAYLYQYLNYARFNEGNTLLPFQEYRDKNPYVKQPVGKNLFNRHTAIKGCSFSGQTGEVIIAENHYGSEFIKIKPDTTYSFTPNTRYVFYDNEKHIISGATGYVDGNQEQGLATSPVNSVYIRVAPYVPLIDEFMLNEGAVLLDYEPYEIDIQGIKIRDINKTGYIDKKRFVIDEIKPGKFTAETISSKDLMNTNTTDMYDLYDRLVSEYPEYVSKTLWGEGSGGEDIYRYDFKPTNFGRYSTAQDIPKMILVAGTHGNELIGVYNLYESLRQITENWKTDETLEVLRWNVHFIVLPVTNPYGFDRNYKYNANKVNLNRNFEPGWVEITDSARDDYGGPAPLSEVESQHIDRLQRENKDAIYYVGYHNFYSSEVIPHFFTWVLGGTDFQVTIGKRYLSKMSRKWKKDHSFFPQNDSDYLGWVGGTPIGSEGRQALKYGIQGGNFETCVQVQSEPDPSDYNSTAITLGVEALVNWLSYVLKENVNFYNE